MTDNMEEATLRGSVTAINNDLSVEVVQRAEGDLAAHLRIDDTLSQLIAQNTDVLSKYLDVKNTQGMDHLELVNYLNALSTDIGNSLFQLNQSIELERDTRVAKYTELHEDVQKYVQMLSDITMDSQQITMDNGDIRLGAWTILSQAREWDLEILAKIANLKTSTQTELNVALDEFQAQLPTKENIISDAIEQLSNAPIITNLDNLLASNIADITVLSGQLLTEVTSIQQTAMANAQEAADNLQLRVSEIQGQLLSEESARIDAMVRESAIRAATIQQASDDMQAQVDVETTARLAAIGLLNDGLTTETQNRIDGDAATLSVINNYKTSNDLALANINQALTTAVTDNSATAQQITALDTRLTDTAQVASTAVSKADSAITANTALASTVDSLTLSLADTTSTVQSNTTALNTLTSDIAIQDGKITAQGSDITDLKNSVTGVIGSLANKADSSALTATNNKVTATENSISTQATEITSLKGTVETYTTNISAAQTAADNAATLAGNRGKVLFQSAEPELTDRLIQNLWIDTTNGTNTPKRWLTNAWVAVTDKAASDALAAANAANTALSTKADSAALTELINQVDVVDGKATTNASSITDLTGRVTTTENQLTTKAEASALTALTTRVTNAEGVNTSQGTSITTLQNTVNHATTGLATKASSTALTIVDNKVTAANGRIDATNSNVTALTGQVSTVEGDISKKADASALTVLTTRVTDAEGVNTSQGTAINNLQNSLNTLTGTVGTKANSSALTALDSKVTAVDGRVTTNSSDITSLENSIETINGTLVTIASSSALTTLDNRVTQTENTLVSQALSLTNLNSAIGTKASAGALSALDTKVTDVDGRLTTTSSSLVTLQTTVGENKSAIAVQGNSINGIKAEYSIKLDVNGLVSGIGLINDGTSSAIGINANYFYVGSVSGGKKPFIITTSTQTINGVSYPAGTWIDTALMANASIGGAKIQSASIDTAQIKDAAITSAKIKDLTADKISVPTTAGVIDKLTATNATITGTSLSGTSALYDGNFKSGSSYASFGSGSGAGTGGETAYLQVDLKALKRIQDISMWYYCADGRRYYYKVKVSKDGTNWDYLVGDSITWALSQEVYKINNSYSNTTTVERINSPGMYFRYLRIYGDGNTINTGNHLYELSVSSQPVSTVIDGNGILTNSITTSKLSADVFTTIAPDGSKSTIEGGTFKVHYPNGNLAVFIGVS